MAYHDDTTANLGGATYRNDAVDIKTTTDTSAVSTGGYAIGYFDTGEWLQYTVNVNTTGTYTLNARVANGTAAASTFHLEVDGANVTGALSVPPTGAWATYTTVTKTGLSLTAGTHTLRFYMDLQYFDFNWLQFTAGSYAYSQSSYYAYSQSSYYAYSQSAYYTYSQSSYYAYSQAAYYTYSQAAYSGGGLAADCTIWASPAGGWNGATKDTPTTLAGASSASVPGSVICLKGGTYNRATTFTPAHSGTASAWIVYKAYGDSPANFVWTGGTDYQIVTLEDYAASAGFLSSAYQYLEFRGLNFDGNNLVGNAFKCRWSHHLRFIGNYMKNLGSTGIATKYCDYLYSDSNKITHTGFNQGWASTISYNSNAYYDNYTGIHSYILNNIVSGEFDGSVNHSDGNGLIMDRAYLSNNDTPTVLILNNVIYQNGGRCFESYLNSHHYWINNTCYQNTLDTNTVFTEADVNAAYNIQFINNIVYGIDSNHYAYAEYGSNSAITFHNNLYFHSKGLYGFTPASGSNFISADPLFVSPPPSALGGYSSALDPNLLGNDLQVKSGSPAINAGFDAATISGLDANIKADLQKYIYKDINGKARPATAIDLGAYEY